MSTERLAFLRLSGPPYEVGLGLGRFGAAAVHDHLTATPGWRQVTALCADPRVERMREAVRERFPRYWDEIRGLADGLGLSLDAIFAWNARGDIRALAPDGCTTVQIPGPINLVAHNEDGDPGFAGHCALAHVASAGGLSFTSFVYPGSLPGHTFAVNAAGLVQTINNVRPLEGGAGLPRMVLTRAVLDAAGLDAAVALIRGAERAGGFHQTLGQAGDPRLLSLEFTATRFSAVDIAAPAVHANHLVHAATAKASQIVTGSSGARQRRGDAMIGAAGAGDPEQAALAILWDRADAELPIHRLEPDDPDVENTLASAVFRIGPERVDWRVYDRAHAPARFVFDGGLEPV